MFIVPLLLLAQLGAHLAVVWHQTHTQFRAPGRTEDTVDGTPVWPKFALKAVGLAFVTFAVLALAGRTVPDQPRLAERPLRPVHDRVAVPARPLRGVARGPAPTRGRTGSSQIFGHTIGELFLPGVVVPGLMFALLAAWPFLEARVSGDHEWHNFAQTAARGTRAVPRSGPAAIALFVVLVIAGGNDVVAKYLDVEVDQLNVILRWLVFLAPVVAGLLTFWICRDLGHRR